MSGQARTGDSARAWWDWAESMSVAMAEAAESNAAAQARFADAWMDAVDESTDQETLDEGVEGVLRAYEVWMTAAQDTFELVNDSVAGETVPPGRFRDTWLNASNQAFKEVFGTTMFAMATGRTAEDLLELRRELDAAAQSTLHDLGLPSRGDLEEVGERLVELERRNHAVESKLDEVIDALDAGE